MINSMIRTLKPRVLLYVVYVAKLQTNGLSHVL